MEIRSAFLNQKLDTDVQGFIVGLGGRDVKPHAVTTAFDNLLSGKYDKRVQWLDLQENPMQIRKYSEAQ